MLVQHGARIGPGRPNAFPKRETPMNLFATLQWSLQKSRPNLAIAAMEFGPPWPDQVGDLMRQAIREGNLAFAAAMLSRGADPGYARHGEERDSAGLTLLMLAIKEHNLGMARLLIDAGADLDARTDEHPPFPWATVILSPVSILGFHEDQYPDMYQMTALIFAVRWGRGSDQMVQLLLDSGADKSIRSQSGDTAKAYADAAYKPAIAEILENHQGAAPKPRPKLMYPLPSAALGPIHDTVRPTGEERDYFWLTAKYPSSPALTHYRRVFSDLRECRGKVPEWETIVDPSGEQDTYVNQLTRHWVGSDNHTLVTLTLRYSSYKLTPEGAPANDRQFVAITKRDAPDAAKEMQGMGYNCARRWF